MSDSVNRELVLGYIDYVRVIGLGKKKALEYICKYVEHLPSERPSGKWSEKEVIHKAEAETVIEEWQSCQCSVCGRYDTRPYLYYFDEPHFCSWCGADMRGEAERSE